MESLNWSRNIASYIFLNEKIKKKHLQEEFNFDNLRIYYLFSFTMYTLEETFNHILISRVNFFFTQKCTKK